MVQGNLSKRQWLLHLANVLHVSQIWSVMIMAWTRAQRAFTSSSKQLPEDDVKREKHVLGKNK